MDIYLVGGAVRDELLGRPVDEFDWVVVGGNEKALVDAGYRSVGRDFPVFLHPQSGDEYALARTERRTGRGHRAFECETEAVTLEMDLHRRDLTINAIAKDDDGNLIDPCGGINDLENRVLRHISPAFGEDPLRVLRVARFASTLASFDFQIHEETKALMRQMVKAGELSDLTPERVQMELMKAMKSDAPEVFFRVLESVGGDHVLWPELNADGIDTLSVVARKTAAEHHRLTAALDATSPDGAIAVLERYHFSNRQADFLKLSRELVTDWMTLPSMKAEKRVDLLYRIDAFRQADRFADLNHFVGLIEEARTGQRLDEIEEAWTTLQARLEGIDRSHVDNSLRGSAIGEAIRAARVAAAVDSPV